MALHLHFSDSDIMVAVLSILRRAAPARLSAGRGWSRLPRSGWRSLISGAAD